MFILNYLSAACANILLLLIMLAYLFCHELPCFKQAFLEKYNIIIILCKKMNALHTHYVEKAKNTLYTFLLFVFNRLKCLNKIEVPLF